MLANLGSRGSSSPIVEIFAKNNGLYRSLFELETVFEESERDFVALAKNLLLKVVDFFEFDGGLLYFFDEPQGEFKLKTLHKVGVDKLGLITKILRSEGGILSRLVVDNNGFTVNNLQSDKWLKSLTNIKDFDGFANSFLALPLRNGDKLVGVVILLSIKRKISPKIKASLNLFLPRAAVQLENARLDQMNKETISENARLYLNISKLYLQATSDSLTGLHNRSFMTQRMKEEVKKAWRFGQPLAVIFADIDSFKGINDEYGHQVGDVLLAEFANLLKSSVREYDVACRFGGEEFLIILPYTSASNAYDLAERLRNKVENRLFEIMNNEIKVTASFGVSALPPIEKKTPPVNSEIEKLIESLIATADEALYKAKNEGRNRSFLSEYHEVETNQASDNQ